MKKIISICVFALVAFSSGLFAQNNVTLKLKENTDASYFRRTEFSYSVSGFTSPKEASAFLLKMKENTDVIAVQDFPKDAEGNYTYKIKMKQPFNNTYYLNWAAKLGINFIVNVKGEKHTPQELIQAASKEKNHTNEAHTH